jgi:hypothetical protein
VTNFIGHSPSIETFWRSIILLGRNTASYKFALAKALLEVNDPSSSISLEDLSLPYAHNVCEHLLLNDKQITGSQSTFIDMSVNNMTFMTFDY